MELPPNKIRKGCNFLVITKEHGSTEWVLWTSHITEKSASAIRAALILQNRPRDVVKIPVGEVGNYPPLALPPEPKPKRTYRHGPHMDRKVHPARKAPRPKVSRETVSRPAVAVPDIGEP